MDLTNKTLLITGGAGAIGTNLVHKLIHDYDCRLRILDDFSSGRRENMVHDTKVEYIEGDVADDDYLKCAFDKQIDIVIHLAANFANQNSVEHPRRDLRTNGEGTLKLLQYSAENKIEKFVFASSSCVYGAKAVCPDETQEMPNLDTPYAITKKMGEYYVRYFHEMEKLPAVILRYFNSYGPWEYPGKYRNVIPNFFASAMKGEPLLIMGTGEETRDYNYVEDTVRGTILAMLYDTKECMTFNIGTTVETSVKELAERINELTGNKAGITFTEIRKWDSIKRRCANIDLSKRLLSYEPKIILEEGLKKTHEWFKAHTK